MSSNTNFHKYSITQVRHWNQNGSVLGWWNGSSGSVPYSQAGDPEYKLHYKKKKKKKKKASVQITGSTRSNHRQVT
jgi:hypothetical protein